MKQPVRRVGARALMVRGKLEGIYIRLYACARDEGRATDRTVLCPGFFMVKQGAPGEKNSRISV